MVIDEFVLINTFNVFFSDKLGKNLVLGTFESAKTEMSEKTMLTKNIHHKNAQNLVYCLEIEEIKTRFLESPNFEKINFENSSLWYATCLPLHYSIYVHFVIVHTLSVPIKV